MIYFDFLKKVKIQKKNPKFFGRHEQYYFTKKLLGISLDQDLESAQREDLLERTAVIIELEKRINEIKTACSNPSFIPTADFFAKIIYGASVSINTDITCVLINDSGLNDIFFDILENALVYNSTLALENGSITQEAFIEKTKQKQNFVNNLIYIQVKKFLDLGGLLATEEQCFAWLFVCGLTYSENPMWAFLGMQKPEKLEETIQKLRSLNKRLFEENKINKSQKNRIEQLIQKSIDKSKKS